MKKNNKTAMVMSVAVLTLVLLGTACNNNNNAPSASPTLSASPSATSGTVTEGIVPEVQEGTGEYEGQVDNHSIEIKTEAGLKVFQITPEIGEKLSSWESGVTVKYQFTEETLDSGGQSIKQLTIVTIDKQ